MKMIKSKISSGFVVLLLFASAVHALGDSNYPGPGTIAPGFSLTSNEGRQVSLSDYRGKWIVLYFYPRDFTSGCTIEAHNFQRDIKKYEEANAVIIGVSVDSAESHKSFCTKEGLSFKLLSDRDGHVSDAYGSLKDYSGTMIAARNTFIIDPAGKIAKVFTGVSPTGHSDEVLAVLAELQKTNR